MSYSISAVAETIDSTTERGREDLAFQPETILPEQFLAEIRSRATGERLLLVALLQDAIDCFQKFLFATRPRNRRLFREAEQWIMNEEGPRDESMHPYFSFEQTCCYLDLDPDYVRGELLRWRQRQLAEVSQPLLRSPSDPSSSRRATTGRGRSAFSSSNCMDTAQVHPKKFTGSVPGRRAVQRIAS